MTDQDALHVLHRVMQLALVLREEGPAAVSHAAEMVFRTAGGDCTAALIIACALINVDEPVDRWWQPTAVSA